MSDLFLYDDATARRFEPFALTRPAGEMRAGAMLVRERWEYVFVRSAAGTVCAPHLATFDEPGAAKSASGTIPAGSILANARFCPTLTQWPPADVWRNEGHVVAVVLKRPLDVAELKDGRVTLDDLVTRTMRVAEVPGLWMQHVWDYIGLLQHMLIADIEVLGKTLPTPEVPRTAGKYDVFIEKGAIVEPHVLFDASAGPVLVRKGATVQAFTRLVGPIVVGTESIVGVDRISGCSIGDHCKIHGELVASIVIGHTNKSHDGFVGHSYLGRWVNLGAGTITSNLKNTYGSVEMWTPAGTRDTGLQFLGTLFGDHVKTGIGSTLTTGSVIGAGASIFGTAVHEKVVPPFAWGEHAPYSTYQLAKFLDVAQRVMQRRQVELSAGQAKVLSAAHKRRWAAETRKKKR